MAKVEVEIGPTGMGTVRVDGTRMEHLVRSTTIYGQAGAVTRVELELVTGIEGLLQGDVKFIAYFAGVSGSGETPRKAIEDVLAHMPQD